MTDEQKNTDNAPNGILLKSVSRLLRPLIRLLIAHQITYPVLIGLLKKIYVDVAEDEFQVQGQRQSDSRINLLTGVHRKDVKKLRGETSEPPGRPGNASVGARIIGYWMGSEEFTDAQGRPRALAQKTEIADEPGFDLLVERFLKQDIRPRVILDEWVRLGVAHFNDEDQVVLNTGAFTPSKGFKEKTFFFGKNIQDHIDAGTRNLLGETPSYFDRSVYYDGLTLKSIEELEQLAEHLGMAALSEMNKQALAKQRRDQKNDETDYRMNFGIFNYNTAHKRGDEVPDE